MFLNLLATFTLMILLSFAGFRWKRRRLYRMAEQFDGPPTLPIIGNALQLGKSSDNILNSTFIDGTLQYPSPSKMWLVHRLVFTVYDPVNFETLMNHPNALEKDLVYEFISPLMETGTLVASVPLWKKHKKMVMPSFNQKILNGFVEIFTKNSNILVKQLEKEVDKGTFDVIQYMSRLTLDSICETAMGVSINAQTTDADFIKWMNTYLKIGFDRITYRTWSHYFDFFFNNSAVGKEFHNLIAKLHKFTDDIMKQKKTEYEQEKHDIGEVQPDEAPTIKKSLLRQLIELRDSGADLSDSEIRDEVMVFLAGGADTSASVEASLLVMLGMHPEIQEKVYNEIIDTIGYDRPVDYSDLPHLTYTEMVIKETMRIFPAGPLIARLVTGDIPLKDGRVIPEGSSLIFAILLAHRNSEYWPDPLKFDPLRFLPEECAKRHPYCYVPFSSGPRKCLGINYAMMAMKTVIATVVKRYYIKTNYKRPEDIRIIQSIAINVLDGYTISIEERSR